MWKLKQPDTTFLFNQINSLTLAMDLIFLFWIIQVTLGAHSLSLMKWNKPVNLQLTLCVHDPMCSCFGPLIPKLFDLLTCRWCLMWAVGPEYCPCSLPGQGPNKSLQLTNQKSSIRLWTLSGKSHTPFWRYFLSISCPGHDAQNWSFCPRPAVNTLTKARRYSDDLQLAPSNMILTSIFQCHVLPVFQSGVIYLHQSFCSVCLPAALISSHPCL